jgi:hypothetical protein
VTPGAVFVRERVTDLAADLVFVNPVLFGILGLGLINAGVTVKTLRAVFNFIPVCVILSVTMHLIGRVTLAAFEIFLAVNIGRNPFVLSKVLFLDSASMARGTNGVNGRSFLEEMAFKKTSSGRIGTADMALTATAVTFCAVGFSCHVHFPEDLRGAICPNVNCLFEGGKAYMETFLIIFSNVIMTRATGLRGVGIGWVPRYSLMRRFPVRIIWVAAMAFLTAQLAVIFVFSKGTVHENLFVRSQRLHFSTSPLSFGFR